jgi:hypothetical protein
MLLRLWSYLGLTKSVKQRVLQEVFWWTRHTPIGVPIIIKYYSAIHRPHLARSSYTCTNVKGWRIYKASMATIPMAPARPEPMTAVGRAAMPAEVVEAAAAPDEAALEAALAPDEAAFEAELTAAEAALEAELTPETTAAEAAEQSC